MCWNYKLEGGGNYWTEKRQNICWNSNQRKIEIYVQKSGKKRAGNINEKAVETNGQNSGSTSRTGSPLLLVMNGWKYIIYLEESELMVECKLKIDFRKVVEFAFGNIKQGSTGTEI